MAASIKDPAWLDWIASLIGGTSPQRYTATFPPDYYWCVLDELPLHLVRQRFPLPARHDVRQEVVLNPLAQILPHGQIPATLLAHSSLLERFALQGVIAWIPGRETDSLLPFWLTPRLGRILPVVAAGGVLDSKLSDEDYSLLIAAGLFQTDELAEQQRGHWRELITRSAEMFHQHNYASIRNLIHPFHVAALRRYFRYMIRRGLIDLGDEQCPRRYGAHNDSVARFFHHHLADTVSAVVGETVKPSYVYSACYLSGAELKRHTDREQCEYSVTFCLDFSPEPDRETPWPIRLETPQGPALVFQALGDGLVYRGTRVPHYRDVLAEGQTSTSIFFHYVAQSFSGSLD